jgi:DNA-directed RNA polymerase specialized sigma24 family protein
MNSPQSPTFQKPRAVTSTKLLAGLQPPRTRLILIKLALRYWKQLPPHVKCSYDLEDMLSDMVLYVIKRSEKYSSGRGAPSTFTWTVAENYCRTLLKRETWQKRATEGMSYIDAPLLDGLSPRLLSEESYQCKLNASRKAVEMMIRFASDELREALSDLLTAKRSRYGQYMQQEMLAQEVRKLAKRHNISADDFRTVMQGLT